MASCQARILGEEYTIQGTDVKCHHTRECGAPSVKKITVDDGDAYFHICAACFRRFLTKGASKAEKDTWLGWFDCDYPPHARVTHSAWYHEEVKKAWDAYNKKQEEGQAEPKQLRKKMLKEEIAALLKKKGPLTVQEHLDKLKKLTKLRVELRTL